MGRNRSGVLELAVLGLLNGTPMHGYELRKRLYTVLGAFRALSYGSLYPCLHELQDAGLITRLQDRLSPQTAQDLAALPSPAGAPTQLPKTGASDSRAAPWLLALGLVCALTGAMVRRAWLLHR